MKAHLIILAMLLGCATEPTAEEKKSSAQTEAWRERCTDRQNQYKPVYVQDSRTGLCFAIFRSGHAIPYANVPCTAQVISLLCEELPPK